MLVILFISKLVEIKTLTLPNSKYLLGYLDKVTKPLVLILLKMRGYVKTFKVKDRDKDKNNKLMLFSIDDEKLLEKYNTICNTTEDLKNIELNDLPVYDDRCIKSKIRTYGNKLSYQFSWVKCGIG